MAGMHYEYQRLRRMLWPSKYDHSAYMLIGIVGRYWLLLTGWKREYRVLGQDSNGKPRMIIIDLCQPRLKLALEADGERFHMDVAREYERDWILRHKGYSVRHYRYPRLRDEPRKVKREIRRWYWNALILNYRPK